MYTESSTISARKPVRAEIPIKVNPPFAFPDIGGS